ncbi:ATP synthase F0 sector subunit b' [hydrothermal vent metagenome]|uniref:ATP synthase F0 sector subunit b n=1 Tax=hydrothermal vent metagenome TaxID=652676 RepID=A0A3B1E0L9_9ZZZZ
MLDISPILLLSSGIIFLLILARLNSYLYKPLFKHMDDRTTLIKVDLENAKKNGLNIDDMLLEVNEIISQAKKKASLIREDASRKEKEMANLKLNDIKADLDVKYEDFIKSLNIEKQSLRESLVNNIPMFKKNLELKISSM